MVKNTYGEQQVQSRKIQPKDRVDQSTNPNAEFCGRPEKGQFFGPGGLGPSVGILVQIPGKDGKTWSVLSVHLSGATSPDKLIDFDFPKGSHGVICGGDNSGFSPSTYKFALDFFEANKVKLDGVIDWTGCFIGHDGKYYVRESDTPSKNNPSCVGNEKKYPSFPAN